MKNDITSEPETIVNAANSQLNHGGGVAGAIARQAGNKFCKESKLWINQHGEVPTGCCTFTSAGNIK